MGRSRVMEGGATECLAGWLVGARGKECSHRPGGEGRDRLRGQREEGRIEGTGRVPREVFQCSASAPNVEKAPGTLFAG